MKSKYRIKGLDCANCAAELERKVKKIDGIRNANISFIMQRMEIEYDETKKNEIIKNLARIIKREEPDIKLEEI